MKARVQDWIERYGIWGVLAFATFLRFFRLTQRPLNLDEIKAVVYGKMPILQIFCESIRSHPPLYYVINHFFLLLFGDTDLSVQLVVTLAGIFTIFIVYLLAQHLWSKKVGLLSALLMSVSLYHLEYSRQVRSYSLAALFVVWGLFWFFLYKDRHKKRYLAGATCVFLAAVYTHYFAWLVVATIGIWIVLRERKNISFVQGTLWAGVALFIGYIPHVTRAMYQFIGNKGAQIAETFSWGQTCAIFPKNSIGALYRFGFGYLFLDVETHLSSALLWGSLLVPLILFCVGLYACVRAKKELFWKVLIFLGIPFIVLSFYAVSNPQRFLMMQSPWYFLVLAGGIVFFWKKIWMKTCLFLCSIDDRRAYLFLFSTVHLSYY